MVPQWKKQADTLSYILVNQGNIEITKDSNWFGWLRSGCKDDVVNLWKPINYCIASRCSCNCGTITEEKLNSR